MQEDLESSLDEIDQQKSDIDKLVREVNELRGSLSDMKKFTGYDEELFDEVDEFDKKVSRISFFGGGNEKKYDVIRHLMEVLLGYFDVFICDSVLLLRNNHLFCCGVLFLGFL